MEPEKMAKVPDSQSLRGPQLLKLLPLETKLFDNISSSGSESGLSGPFSDAVFNKEVEVKKKTKQLYGRDLYTAFSFSTEFKTAMEEVKKEMIKDNSNYYKIDNLVNEDLEALKSKLTEQIQSEKPSEGERTAELPQEEEEKEEEVEEEKRKTEGEEEEKQEEEKEGEMEEKKKDKKKGILMEEDEIVDTMSGYWRMLSVFDEFRISPPWYDAFAEGKEHWLQTKPMPAEVYEKSREKCLSWLDKHFK